LFVCENNSSGALGSAGGGFPTSVSAVDDLTDIPKTFGIPIETVDGRDPDAVAEIVAKGIDHTRARKGPFFVHVATARFAGTQPLWPTLPTGPTDISMAWDDSGMSGEHEQWYREHDPVLGYARKLLASGDITQEELTELDARVSERIAEARQFALDSPRPTPESALDNVFA
jgi:pyruvate dehydrogenase E1 component alpha subunit